MSDEVISIDDAEKELSQLRSRGGGRKSMFAEYLDDIEALDDGEAFTTEVDGYGRVSGLRRYVDDNASGNYEVKSARAEGEGDKDQSEATYKVFVIPD